ncbi:hypothetical protein M153_11430003292, partial [Pseudoloma neurophilia]
EPKEVEKSDEKVKKSVVKREKPKINEFVFLFHKNTTYKFQIVNLVPIYALLSTANCEKDSNNLVIGDDIGELKDAFKFLFENGNSYDNTTESKIKYRDIQKIIYISKIDENYELRVYVISQENKVNDLKEIGPRLTFKLLEKYNGYIFQKKKAKIEEQKTEAVAQKE